MNVRERIQAYYEDLNSGDAAAVARHFTDDAVHYYTRLGPHHGREIAENAEWAVETIEGRWSLEHLVADEEAGEAAIEWTMIWRDPRSGEARINRGAEMFRLRDGLISEVRAYHHGDPKNPEGNLLGFDFAGRGYTMLEGKRGPT